MVSMKLSPRQTEILVEVFAWIGAVAFIFGVFWVFAQVVMRYA